MTYPITVLRDDLKKQQAKLRSADEYIATASRAENESIRENNINYLNIVKRDTQKKADELEKAIEVLEQVDLVNKATKAINDAFRSILGDDVVDGLTKPL